jgi:hypothetical protein
VSGRINSGTRPDRANSAGRRPTRLWTTVHFSAASLPEVGRELEEGAVARMTSSLLCGGFSGVIVRPSSPTL